MKIRLFCMILTGTTTLAEANSFQFLEEKTAYCYSESSLSQYLNMARSRNIDGMNRLVLDGECDFVPDGEVYSLTDYRKSSIGSMSVVAFEKGDQTLWTFKALVQTTQINNL